MSMRNRQDHNEARAYRYYVFVDAERGRGFDDEVDALMHYDEEILLAQKSADDDKETYTVCVVDELSAGKDACVAQHTCFPSAAINSPEPKPVFERPKFIRESVSKKERA